MIIDGDWNVILSMKLDARKYMSIVTRPRARNKIFELMTMHDIVDVFRKLYPDKRHFTWRRCNTTKQGRLDCFLISDSLLSEVIGTKANLWYRSDHSVVELSLKKRNAAARKTVLEDQ